MGGEGEPQGVVGVDSDVSGVNGTELEEDVSPADMVVEDSRGLQHGEMSDDEDGGLLSDWEDGVSDEEEEAPTSTATVSYRDTSSRFVQLQNALQGVGSKGYGGTGGRGDGIKVETRKFGTATLLLVEPDLDTQAAAGSGMPAFYSGSLATLRAKVRETKMLQEKKEQQEDAKRENARLDAVARARGEREEEKRKEEEEKKKKEESSKTPPTATSDTEDEDESQMKIIPDSKVIPEAQIPTQKVKSDSRTGTRAVMNPRKSTQVLRSFKDGDVEAHRGAFDPNTLFGSGWRDREAAAGTKKVTGSGYGDGSANAASYSSSVAAKSASTVADASGITTCTGTPMSVILDYAEVSGKTLARHQVESEPVLLVNWTAASGGMLTSRPDPKVNPLKDQMYTELIGAIWMKPEDTINRLVKVGVAWYSSSDYWDEDVEVLEDYYKAEATKKALAEDLTQDWVMKQVPWISTLSLPKWWNDRSTESLWGRVSSQTPWAAVNLLKSHVSACNADLGWKADICFEIENLALQMEIFGREKCLELRDIESKSSIKSANYQADGKGPQGIGSVLAWRGGEEDNPLGVLALITGSVLIHLPPELYELEGDDDHVQLISDLETKMMYVWLAEFGCLPPSAMWEASTESLEAPTGVEVELEELLSAALTSATAVSSSATLAANPAPMRS